MKVTQISAVTARQLEQALPRPKVDAPDRLPLTGLGLAAFLSPTASPTAVPSDVAAVAIPIVDDGDGERARSVEPMLHAILGTPSVSAKQLKGMALIGEGLRVYNPALATPVKVLGIVAATQEVIDAMTDDDASQWQRLLSAGKLVVKIGDAAADYADVIPGMAQAAPYLQAAGVIVKISDGATLFIQNDRPQDPAGARRLVQDMEAYASGSAPKRS